MTIQLDRASRTRNGLPERRDYTYRGTGTDTLTGHLGEAQLRQYAGIDTREFLPGFARGGPALAARTEVTRQQLAICPACDAGLCDTCFGGTCTCACIDYRPEPARAEAEPGPPERCEVCGYLVTAPGHLLSCGTPDARRIMAIAGSIR